MPPVSETIPSTVPPLISTVVILPKSAIVFPALVQLLLMVKLEPSSALIVSSAISPTFVILPSLKDVAVVEAITKVPSSVIVLSVITVPPIVKSVVASIVVPVISPADTVSRLAVPSMYKSFHSNVDEPKSDPLSAFGTIFPLAVI